MRSYSGTCHCTKVRITLNLPRTLGSYSARKCDCDFCMQRDIRYLSDPQAALLINSSVELHMQKQGSEQALFVTCSECLDVIAATIDTDKGLIGAINATLLQDAEQLQPASIVSPKKLSAEDKVARWLTVWQPVTVAKK